MSEQLDFHYGLRLGCIILVWFALGGTILNSVDQRAFFSAILLFLIPLSFDYYSHQPIGEKNKKRRNIGIWSTILLAAICLGITFAGFNLEVVVLKKSFKTILWIGSIFYVIMAVVDWITYSSSEEMEHREMIKKLQREKRSNEPLEERVEYYRSESLKN